MSEGVDMNGEGIVSQQSATVLNVEDELHAHRKICRSLVYYRWPLQDAPDAAAIMNVVESQILLSI